MTSRLRLLPRLAAILLLALAYATLLTTAKFNLLFPKPYGLVFNSMLDHMLHGSFDIDPAVVGPEGYVRNGLTYAYWGIFCALLRLPLLLIPGGLGLDVTTPSCVAAATLATAAKLHGLLWLRRDQPGGSTLLFFCLLADALAAGPLFVNLAPDIYSEPIFWAYALASCFVVASVQALVRGHFGTGRLAFMAACAAAALLARNVTGAGLYLALGAVLLPVLARRPSAAIAPLLITLAGIAVTGLVNAMRWGNPLVGQDLSGYLYLVKQPEGIGVLARHGMMSLARVPAALQYYLAPFYTLRGPDGRFLLEATDRDLFYLVELPPSSLLATDLLPLSLGLLFLALLLRRRTPFPRRLTLGLLLALLAPVGVVLTYWALTNRYRLECAPLLDALALLAFATPELHRAVTATTPRRLLLLAATALSVGASLVTFVLFRLSYYGNAPMLLRDGFSAYYQSRYRNLARELGLPLPFSRQR